MTRMRWYLFLYLFITSLATIRFISAEIPSGMYPKKEQKLSFLGNWGRQEECDELEMSKLSEIHLNSHDLKLHFGGLLKDDFFMYSHAYTLRTDYHDQIDFFRHKLHLDLLITQGTNKFGKPVSQAGIRLKNYVFWAQESHYMPCTIDTINVPQLNNLAIAQDIPVRPLMPLIFVEQAWFKLNFDTFIDYFKDHPTFLKVGYFPYIAGRGVALGFHEDLAVDYLGWAGEGGFTRFPFMPAGILFRTQINEHLTWDVYFNLWKETNASLSDVLQPYRQERLYGKSPERGSGKDRTTWVTKLDFSKHYEDFGQLLVEPYFLYVDAPEQGIEFKADASSKLFTCGVMADWSYNNFKVNVEFAGQFGHQHMHAIDRNIIQLNRSASTGAIFESFSHVNLLDATPNTENNPASQTNAPVGEDKTVPPPATARDFFTPGIDDFFLVDAANNRDLSQQGQLIKLANENPSKESTFPTVTNLVNSEVFGNKRFRNPYTLHYQSFMLLADITYEFTNHPFKLAGALGHISGDNYPYNDETSRNYNGFIPLRSRYRGLAIQNFFMFDRQVTPRPLNIANRTLYAFNDLKDLSNLQFIGIGGTWYPYCDRSKLQVTLDIMWLWEAATLNKWDTNGKHPDPAIEAQLVRLRNTPQNNNGTLTGQPPTLFSGWEANEHARRMLGTEIDFKVYYKILDHCQWTTKIILFFPGGLYKDLDGQPNQITQRIDERGFTRYDSLGHKVAFAFVTGLNYGF